MTNDDLNRHIAERVLGWTIYGPAVRSDWHALCTAGDFEDVAYLDNSGVIWRWDGDADIQATPFDPATDCADADLVIYAMAQRGYWCQMRTPRYDGDTCGAVFTPCDVQRSFAANAVSAETLPRAVCLAALAAVGDEAEPAPFHAPSNRLALAGRIVAQVRPWAVHDRTLAGLIREWEAE